MDITLINALRMVDEKINLLSEQDVFSPSISIAEIKGQMNLMWTNCTRTRCARVETSFQQRICKFDCQRTALQDATTKISAQKSNCARTKNPNACMSTFESVIKAMNNKISNIAVQINNVRRQEAQSRAKMAGGRTTPGGGAAPGGGM
jgi:hypothetical protein